MSKGSDVKMSEMEKIFPIIKSFIEQGYPAKWDAFQQLNQLAEQGGIVFAGDSITEGFHIHELFAGK